MMNKCLLVLVSLLSFYCYTSDSRETSQERQCDRIMSWSSDDSIVDLEDHSRRLVEKEFAHQEYIESRHKEDTANLAVCTLSLLKPRLEKPFVADKVLEKPFVADKVEEGCKIIVPPNTPVVRTLSSPKKHQPEVKKIFGYNREIVIASLSAVLGCSLILVPHTVIHCPGEHCLWTGGVPWY